MKNRQWTNTTPPYAYVYGMTVDELREEIKTILEPEPYPGDAQFVFDVLSTTEISVTKDFIFHRCEVRIWPNGYCMDGDFLSAFFKAWLIWKLHPGQDPRGIIDYQ